MQVTKMKAVQITGKLLQLRCRGNHIKSGQHNYHFKTGQRELAQD